MTDFAIRPAQLYDAESLLNIYSYYVENTAITFEYDVPSPAEFAGRIEKTTKKYPYIVAENHEGIIGYAYADTFKDRAAYDHCVEVSIYLKNGYQGKGLGRALYEAIEALLKDMGIINLYACIAVTENEDEYLTNQSEHFHRHLGYETVGSFRKSGRKFNRWYDMIWMEKIIGEYED
ncbi:MAG: N-acetyltransferase [Oscillospiraceae bacterium]|nr:N-acetyltransferase [Oscillospiraceae bacterium]